MVRTILVLTAAAGLVGCAHEGATASTSSGFMQQSKEAFVDAYDAVKTGAQKTASAGKYAIQAVGHGTVRVYDQSKAYASSAGNTAQDGWITTKVKSEYAVDPVVKATKINVDTDDGIVKLTGYVESPQAAERAINTALATKGVVAVDSNLQYPAGARNQIYVAPVRER